MPYQRFGIVGGDDPARQANVGKVFAVGVGGGIGQIGRT